MRSSRRALRSSPTPKVKTRLPLLPLFAFFEIDVFLGLAHRRVAVGDEHHHVRACRRVALAVFQRAHHRLVDRGAADRLEASTNSSAFFTFASFAGCGLSNSDSRRWRSAPR